MARTTRTATCWIWNGGINSDGYGVIRDNDGTMRLTHRIVYQHVKGTIPTDLELDHKCTERRCVRPRHLEAVTHAENMRRVAVRRKQRAA